MAFDNLPRSKVAARTDKKDPIFGIGCRAFVNWPHPNEAVPWIVAAGELPVANDLVDGQEVEIVSWRPRSREGLVYQVRRLSDGREGWILALHLRRERAVQPAAAGTSKPRPVRLPDHQ